MMGNCSFRHLTMQQLKVENVISTLEAGQIVELFKPV